MPSVNDDVRFFYNHAKKFNDDARDLMRTQFKAMLYPLGDDRTMETTFQTAGYVFANLAKAFGNLALALGALGLCIYSLGGDSEAQKEALATVGLQIATAFVNVINMGLAFFALLLRPVATLMGPIQSESQNAGGMMTQVKNTISELVSDENSVDEELFVRNFGQW